MDGEFYTEDQLQNLELEQARDEFDKAVERFLAAMDKSIERQLKENNNNFPLVQKKLDSIAYEFQRS